MFSWFDLWCNSHLNAVFHSFVIVEFLLTDAMRSVVCNFLAQVSVLFSLQCWLCYIVYIFFPFRFIFVMFLLSFMLLILSFIISNSICSLRLFEVQIINYSILHDVDNITWNIFIWYYTPWFKKAAPPYSYDCNFYKCWLISIIFGIQCTELICNVIVVDLPMSPMYCCYTTLGNKLSA